MMIKLADFILFQFVDFLNDKYPTSKDVYLSVLHGNDSVKADDGSAGWAVYSPANVNGTKKDIILLPGEVPDVEGANKNIILENLAHEYCHHIQNCEGRLKNNKKIETEAVEFAAMVMRRWLKRLD